MGVEDLERSARDGDVVAQITLGDHYYKTKNYQKALPYFMAAAEQGDAYAMYSIGHIYFEEGPLEDDRKAHEWFEKAAELGHADAQYWTANDYFTGKGGVKRSNERAAYWCRKAADQMHPKALEAVQTYEQLATQRSSCIIATACAGEQSGIVHALRQVRDTAISSDPVARDFFHVFWSRYYEWSPQIARMATENDDLRRHLRWSFVEPWFAWLDLASLVGQRRPEELSDTERSEVVSRLCRYVTRWLEELPEQMEAKEPNRKALLDALSRFRDEARKAFEPFNGSGAPSRA